MDKIFLYGIIESAEDACETVKLMKSLSQESLVKINSLTGRKSTVVNLFNYVERNPIIDIGKTAEALGLQYNTVAKAVDKLVSLGILEQINTYKRNRRFGYTKYLDILRKDT